MNELLQTIGILAGVIGGAYFLWWILTRDEARRHRNSMNNTSQEDQVNDLYRAALKHYNANRYDDCLLGIEQAYLLAEAYSLMDRPVAARICNLRGCMHQYKGEWRKALRCYDVAINIASKWIHGDAPENSVFKDIESYATNAQKAREYLGF